VIAIISAAKPENAVARSHKSRPAQDDEASGAATAKAPTTAAERPRTDGAVPVSGGRILASPKTRRLAREKGLDLNLLVENGVPQPYHVSDLGLLETLVPSTKAAGAAPRPQLPGPCRCISARALLQAAAMNSSPGWLMAAMFISNRA
jgi:pyruvate/2-oxoglutarate dehydrogenase complex dihydrolipoamide acyltransferase (E2) component